MVAMKASADWNQVYRQSDLGVHTAPERTPGIMRLLCTLRYLIAEQDGLREQDETSSAKS